MCLSVAYQVISKLESHGHQAYIVGGIVRDRLLGRFIGDIDIATSAQPFEVQQIFLKTIPIGVEHGTVIVRLQGQSFEVTTFRMEGSYQDYRRPSEVQFHHSIEADLARRDFTINALALKRNGEILDPFGGTRDLKKRLLRAVGDPFKRFQEDPLRMMRAIRLVSVLGFDLEPHTKKALVACAPLLKHISVERIRDEFGKLLSGVCCNKAIQLLEDTSIGRYFPVSNFTTIPHKYDWNLLEETEERWAGLILLLNVSAPRDWLDQWKLPKQRRNHILKRVNLVSKKVDLTSNWELYKNGLQLFVSVARIYRFLQEPVSFDTETLHDRFHCLPIQSRADIVINGNDLQNWLGRAPGPWIAVYMEAIEEKLVEGVLDNSPSHIKEWITNGIEHEGGIN